jgi:Flp pilus assembly protein TadD
MVCARLVVGVMVAVASGACASTGARTLSDRFVIQGTPAVDLGGPLPAASRAATPRHPLEGTSIAHVPSRTSGTMSSLESFDAHLRDALMRVRLAPTAAHHLQVARAYRRLGIFDTAYDYLARSLTVNGSSPAVHDALARLWRDWGYPGLGLSHAYQAVNLAPDWPAAHNTLGTLLYRLGHREEARARFASAVELDPRAAYALDNLCLLSMADGETREAIAFCQQAKAAHRGRPSVHIRPESR